MFHDFSLEFVETVINYSSGKGEFWKGCREDNLQSTKKHNDT